MSLVSALELRKYQDAKREIKKDTYKAILGQFSNKIRNSAELGKKATILVVPQFVMGFPIFDRTVATTYLERQLKNGGYAVRRMDPITIYTDWSKLGKQSKPVVAQPMKEETTRDFGDMNGLVNLKKIANKYKK
mgnify:CR=1 FL=1